MLRFGACSKQHLPHLHGQDSCEAACSGIFDETKTEAVPFRSLLAAVAPTAPSAYVQDTSSCRKTSTIAHAISSWTLSRCRLAGFTVASALSFSCCSSAGSNACKTQNIPIASQLYKPVLRAQNKSCVVSRPCFFPPVVAGNLLPEVCGSLLRLAFQEGISHVC